MLFRLISMLKGTRKAAAITIASCLRLQKQERKSREKAVARSMATRAVRGVKQYGQLVACFGAIYSHKQRIVFFSGI